MEQDAQVVCRKCRKSVRVNELRQERDLWICHDCYEKAHFFPEVKMTSFSNETRHVKPTPPSFQKGGLKLFMCGGCGYKLEREHFDRERACPYCGDKSTMRPVQ